MLEDYGIEGERFRLEWILASEWPKFTEVVEEMAKPLKDLGPNPYNT